MDTAAELTAEELLNALREEVDNAAEDGDRADMREDATGFFFGELPPPPDDPREIGYADLVSTDVGDAIESVLAEIMPTFASSPVQFQPLGEQDERAAEIESRVVNHKIMAAGGYLAFGQAIKSALLHRAGVVKVSWETRKVPHYEVFDRSPIEALIQSLDSGAELLSGEQDADGGVTGMIRGYEIKQTPRVDAIPLDEFLICQDAMPGRMQEARFVAQRRLMPRGELVALGFEREIVDELHEFDSSSYSERNRRSEQYTDHESAHKSTDPVMCIDAYYRIDADGDGIAELRRVITAGGTDGHDKLLFDEPVSDSPFAVGLAYLGLFTWDGVSLCDKLREVQTFKTEMLRSLADIFRRASRQRIGVVERDANFDDVQTSVRGGSVRCKTHNGVFPIQEAQLPAGSFDLLAYMDKIRRDKGGGAVDVAAQAQAVSGDTAHGIERTMSAIEQINAMVARNLAETLVKPVYRLMHSLLRAHMQGQVPVPGPSGWQSTEPAAWQPREEMVLSIGMSTAERQRRAAALGQVVQMQQTAMEGGLAGQITDLSQIHRALIDMGRMLDLPNPEQYWISPESEQAQKSALGKQQAAEQEKQAAQQLALMQYQILPQVENIKSQTQLQLGQMKLAADAELQEMRNTVDMLKAAMDQQAKALDARIRILDIESKVDAQDAASEIDRMQAKTDDAPSMPEEDDGNRK